MSTQPMAMPMANQLFFAFFTFASLSDCYSSLPCWEGGSCKGSISGVNLNFTVSWDACQENASASSFILSKPSPDQSCDDPSKMILCETNNTSCFVGGRLLEGVSRSYYMEFLCLQRSVGGKQCTIIFSRSNYLVGQPDILSSDVKSRNITLTMRGPLTPIYRAPGDESYRGLDSSGMKHKTYMGMEFITDTIDCLTTLYNSTGDPIYQIKDNLGDESAQLKVDFTNLVPYTRYQIKIKCVLNDHWSNYTTYDFITAEDVPARGPSVLKPDSVGLGCEKPDQRNVTIVIEPPPLEDHNGRLLFYEIRYSLASCGPEWECSETRLRVDLPVPPNSPMMVPLDDLLRWEAYDIVVYANNSAGGAPSSVHQVPILRPEIIYYQPLNLTKTRVEPNGWRIEWFSPWPQNRGDCVTHYEVSAVKDDRYLGITNDTSFFLPTDDGKLIASVRVMAMLYNGTGSIVKGLSSDPITLKAGESSDSVALSTPLIASLSILLLIFIVLALSCAYMCIEHGPRWTENYDFHNNSVLKAALAMGDLRPRPPLEKEEFNNIVNVPPDEDSPNETANTTETRVLLVAETEPEVGEMAVPRTPTRAQMPPPSTEGHQALVRGRRSEESCPSVDVNERSGCILAEEEEDSNSTLVVTCDVSKGYPERNARVCKNHYEESPVASLPPLVFHDVGYVAIPRRTGPAVTPSDQRDGYCKMDTLQNIPCRIATDDGKRWQEFDADRSGYVSKYVRSTLRNEPLPSPEMTNPYIRLSDTAGQRPGRDGDAAMKSHVARQASVDSEGMSSRSLSPSHSDIGEYTKLSCPNTPVSPRNHSTPDPSLLSLTRAVEENFKLMQDKHGCSTESFQHGLSNVA